MRSYDKDLAAERAYEIDGYINYWYSKASKPFIFYKIKMKEANCDELLQQGYAHIPKKLYERCGIMSEEDDGESFF